MARPEQVLLLEPQHELKFRGKRGGPGLDGSGWRPAVLGQGEAKPVTNPREARLHIATTLPSCEMRTNERTAGQLTAS